MYYAFYNLKDNPFRLTPDPAFLYLTPQHREALAGLVYSVCNHSGPTVLVGEVGTGKTTLLRTLLDWLEKRRFITAFCNNPTLTREEFYDLLLDSLQISCSSLLKSRQVIALQEALTKREAEGRRSVLIVDEAHRLSPELLEEIRLLLNMETPREKLLEITLAGQPELTEMLRRDELRQLKQRISCYCRLEPLSPEALREYVQHRLTQAGLPKQTLFGDDTFQFIYECTHGIPRLVNSLCNNALQTGFALQSPCITLAILREAAADLDLLHGAVSELPSIEDQEHPIFSVSSGPQAATRASEGTYINGRNGQIAADAAIPLESYTNRQKSLGFLANLIGRWK